MSRLLSNPLLPHVRTGLVWATLSIVFFSLVGCTTMRKSKPAHDPFLSSAGPDTFSCGESHRTSKGKKPAGQPPVAMAPNAGAQAAEPAGSAAL